MRRDFLSQVLAVAVEVRPRARRGLCGDVRVPPVAARAVEHHLLGPGMHDAPDAVRDRGAHHVVRPDAVDAEGLRQVGPDDGAVDDGVHPLAGRQHLFRVGYVHLAHLVRRRQEARDRAARVAGPGGHDLLHRPDVRDAQEIALGQLRDRGRCQRPAGAEHDHPPDRAGAAPGGRRGRRGPGRVLIRRQRRLLPPAGAAPVPRRRCAGGCSRTPPPRRRPGARGCAPRPRGCGRPTSRARAGRTCCRSSWWGRRRGLAGTPARRPPRAARWRDQGRSRCPVQGPPAPLAYPRRGGPGGGRRSGSAQPGYIPARWPRPGTPRAGRIPVEWRSRQLSLTFHPAGQRSKRSSVLACTTRRTPRRAASVSRT